jgi:hypothetical protein
MLISFQIATIVYDAPCQFCERFIEKRPQPYDQMICAADSGKQNIAEGSMILLQNQYLPFGTNTCFGGLSIFFSPHSLLEYSLLNVSTIAS